MNRFVIVALSACVLGGASGDARAAEFLQKLLGTRTTHPDDNASVRITFGESVGIDEGVALVGAPGDDGQIIDAGTAYLMDAETGSVLHELITPRPQPGRAFGTSAAIDGRFALVGAPFDGPNFGGAAYVFDTGTGALLHELSVPGSISFGASVAIDNGVALIGNSGNGGIAPLSGAAHLFDLATGNLLRTLTAPDGAERDFFGRRVALDGGVALVGSTGDDDNGSASGSAYLFDAASGSLLTKLTAPDGAEEDFFGGSVAIDGGIALVGATGDDDDGSQSGSAYLFDTSSGSLLHKLTAPDAAEDDQFGGSVALDDGVALVGARRDGDLGAQSGSAYVFNAASGVMRQKLLAPDGASEDIFGSSVALDGGIALVGAPGDDDNGPATGSAYVFRIIPEPTGAALALLAVVVAVRVRDRC